MDAVLLCFACPEILCALELQHQSDVFYSSVLQFYCVAQLLCSLCRSQLNGCVNASRRVLVLQCCLAILIVFCKSLLADRIGTATSWMRFECQDLHETLCFFGVTGDSVAEKSRLACATGAAILALPSIPVRFARAVELKVPGDFFSSLWMLCYCVLHALRYYVHWNCCIKAMCSTVVCCNSIVGGDGTTLRAVGKSCEN